MRRLLIPFLLVIEWADVAERGMPTNTIVNLSEGVAPSARLQNRA